MNSLNIQYSGKVTVRYEKNGKILKSYQIHNNGTEELFHYLCRCLANNWEDYANNCPEYIMLYNHSGGQFDETNLGDPVLTSTIFKSKVEVLNSEPYSTWTTKFRFIIPTNSLIENSANVVAIYSANTEKTAISGGTNPSAYTKLVSAGGQDITIDKSTANNVILEWEMSFTNNINTSGGTN